MPHGSHTTFGTYDARVCCICGNRIVITQQSARFHTDDKTGEHRAWHVDCEREHGWPRSAWSRSA